MENEQSLRKLAKQLDMQLMGDLSSCSLVKDKVQKIPYLFAKQKAALPIEESSEQFIVAVSNPIDLDTLGELRLLLQKEIIAVYTPKKVLDDAIERCYRQQEEDKDLLALRPSAELTDEPSSLEEYDLLEQTTKHPVVRILNLIFIEAIQQAASDIHFEPQEDGIRLRYRIDGILQERSSPPQEYQTQLLTRIKVMAQLDIAEQRLPQDGRIKLKMGEREIDFRISTIPVVYGERIVLRILDRDKVQLELSKMGMDESLLALFKELIHLPEGILLVTGPTGSGKTTTLYSALHEILSKEVNIMTIEDPVEYKLPKIAQIAVNPKIDLTFAKGLKHILRQDPDVVMIGEIRDRETAEIAIQASLTGHLVLSTLHTNDAPSALTRLSDMGVEPYLLASSIVGVIAQRLVRKICPRCRISYVPTQQELKKLCLHPESLQGGGLFKGAGCDSCYNTGYKGRQGIYELFRINSEVKSQIMKSVEANSLRRIPGAMRFELRESGAQMVKKGLTTSSEVLRATQLSTNCCED